MASTGKAVVNHQNLNALALAIPKQALGSFQFVQFAGQTDGTKGRLLLA